MARLEKAKGNVRLHKYRMETYTMWLEDLKVLEAQKKALTKEVADLNSATPVIMIGRPPRGVSIQEGMGLSNDKVKYDAIRVR